MPETAVLTKEPEIKTQSYKFPAPETFGISYKIAQSPDGSSDIPPDEIYKAKLRRNLIAPAPVQKPAPPTPVPAAETPPPSETQVSITPQAETAPQPITPRRSFRESLMSRIPSTQHGWKEFAAGAVTGVMARLATKQVAAYAGIAGWPHTLLVGGVAGAMAGLARDFVTQYQATEELPRTKKTLWTDYVLEQQSKNNPVDVGKVMAMSDPTGRIETPNTQYSELKNSWHKLKQVDKARLGKAVLTGAALGVAGAVAGGLVIDALDWLIGQDSGVGVRIPGITPPATPAPPDLGPPNVELPPDTGGPQVTPPGGVETPPGGVDTPPGKPGTPSPFMTDIQNLPGVVDLPQGSNIWNESKYNLLPSVLHRNPTDPEVYRVAYAIAKESGVAVPTWNLQTGILDTRMPVGFDLMINNNVRNVLSEIAQGR